MRQISSNSKGMAEADNSVAAIGQLINRERTTMVLSANDESVQMTTGNLGQSPRRVPALRGGLIAELNVKEPAFDLVGLSTGHISLHSWKIVALS